VCLVDSPRIMSSSRVRRVLARLRFRSGFVLGFCCSQFADGPSFSSRRSGSGADGPPSPCGQSIFPMRLWWFCWLLRTATPGRTVRGTWPDCPLHLVVLSVWPVRIVHPSWPDSPPVPGSFVPWFDSSLLSFVLPRVLQGIVPKT
jgi:hypothetical protein